MVDPQLGTVRSIDAGVAPAARFGTFTVEPCGLSAGARQLN